MKHRDDSAIAWAAIDFLCCLLLVVYMLIAPPKKSTPSIVTLGYYAIVVDWPSKNTNDVDTYVRDPSGHIVYFLDKQVGLMHLEQDDLGYGVSNSVSVNGKTISVAKNEERVIVQGIIPGEYTVNVQMYEQRQRGSTPIEVRLIRLVGNDKTLITKHVVLHQTGTEITAFRFTLNPSGYECCENDIQTKFVQNSLGFEPTGVPANPSISITR